MQLIKFMLSTGSTQSVNSTTWTFTSGTTHNLRFEVSKGDGTTGRIIPYVNDSAGAVMTFPIALLRVDVRDLRRQGGLVLGRDVQHRPHRHPWAALISRPGRSVSQGIRAARPFR